MQWAPGPHWQTHKYAGGGPLVGFEAVRALLSLPGELLMVPQWATVPAALGWPFSPATEPTNTGCCTPATPSSSTVRPKRTTRTAPRVVTIPAQGPSLPAAALGESAATGRTKRLKSGSQSHQRSRPGRVRRTPQRCQQLTATRPATDPSSGRSAVIIELREHPVAVRGRFGVANLSTSARGHATDWIGQLASDRAVRRRLGQDHGHDHPR